MRRFILLSLMLLYLGSRQSPLQAQCTSPNTAFLSGETLSYDLYFNWKFIWLKAGTAAMNITETVYQGEPAFRCNLTTRGSKKADRFFIMRDTLESIVSQELTPLYYRKGALEGKRYHVDQAWYSYPNGVSHIRQRYRNHHGDVSEHQRKSNVCIYDMLSMLLRARSFDAQDYRIDQKINFPMADGGKIEEQTLIYRGKKNFKMENTKVTYRCLVFSFVEYKNGKEKEVITFYISDDENHLPVRLDMFLNFGSAKAFLTGTRGLRNPQTSIIE
ncbi:MAG: DUF3108 domain-containing protein [Paraprevotella sp.]|nr:DUF3108 domain-containing protein [Paraprevotella sp.]